MDQTNRLEQALRVWEDLCFLRRARVLALTALKKPLPYPLDGALRHWQDFRRDLLAAGPDGDFAIEKYVTPAEHMLKAVGANLVSLPIELASWTAQSRRIFRPSEELQALLNATSLDGVRWSDVPWPFGAFAVTLEVPLKGETGIDYDCILVHGLSALDGDGVEKSVIQFRLFSSAFEGAAIDRFTREGVTKALTLKQWPKLDRRMKEAEDRLRRAKTSVFSLVEDKVGDAPVTDAVHELLFKIHGRTCGCGGTHPEWDQAVRLVVGLCLYLSTLPSNSPHRSPWQRPKKSANAHPKAIVNEAEVCTISSAHRLTAEEREAFISDGQHVGTRELSAHWRRGHWRRPPGKGNDPTAPKVVHVRPTLVRRDKLGPGTLTGGSETSMS